MAPRSVSPGVMAVAALAALGIGLFGGKAVFGGDANATPAGGKTGVAGTKVDVIVKATDLIAVGLDQLQARRPAKASAKGTA